ncbi:hypothetical protein BPOR_0295g00050 [Botrytis porri]|uniref:Ubiquitin-like domain-containing protein n=1 Tax=Botrytis porri TaxID=87229 RepID=A0A4Z1KQ03_9HELO|nr:hypothetical protein BPOR_0295g00050 [Botrytis porri]
MSVTTIQDSLLDQSLLASSNQSMLTPLSGVINGEVVLPSDLISLTSTQQMLRMASEIRGMLPAVDTRFTYCQAPVKVEDALGRFFPVPSEYSFDDLRAIIHSRFKEGPGKYQVLSGNYEILNGKNRKQVMSAGYCERRGFLPGSTLTMAIILDDVLKQGDDFYPMPRCGSRASSPVIGGGRTSSFTSSSTAVCERQRLSREMKTSADSIRTHHYRRWPIAGHP